MDTIQPSSLPSILFIAGAIVVGLIVIGLIFAKLYTRATKETAFVRTGLGGEKVIKDGGAIVLPVVHEIIPVNMNTLRIEVEKIQKDALITKDRMRVDVKADFYLRVAPNANGISMAAQTLGTRTTRAEEVKKLMESKFVDVLRAVAAEMSMTEMHEQRADFVQKVQQSVANDLEKNGLELESVSLTGFDQTDLQFFNENNAFDAEGRARLTKIIEEKRKETNDIQQENRIFIEQRNLAAEKQSLEVKRDEEEARLAQEQILAFKRQEQKAEIAKQREMKEREEREAEIAKNRAIEAAEIEKSREIETQEIAKRQALEQARIRQQQEVEVSEQIKQIAVATKSEEESAARAKAAEAEKAKVEKVEAVTTAKMVAEAERKKQIEVIDARKEAEREAVGITVEAQAKKEAAENSAAAILTEAKAAADAKMLQAEADEKVLVAHAVKPLENIEGIKILQGYGQGSGVKGEHTVATAGSGLAEQVTQAALSYRANAPLVDSMLREVGLVDAEKGTLDDLVTGNSDILTKANAVKPKPIVAAPENLNGNKASEELPAD